MTRLDKPLLLYDGDCSFCTGWAQWVAAKADGSVRTASWQSLGPDQLAALGLTGGEAASAAWWIGEDGRRSRGHLAIARALAAGHGAPAAVGRLLLVPPFRWAAAAGYPLVARWRNRLPHPRPVPGTEVPGTRVTPRGDAGGARGVSTPRAAGRPRSQR
jgi:predicted DCC family thiol-disulfide oxidoreductase YuxK